MMGLASSQPAPAEIDDDDFKQSAGEVDTAMLENMAAQVAQMLPSLGPETMSKEEASLLQKDLTSHADLKTKLREKSTQKRKKSAVTAAEKMRTLSASAQAAREAPLSFSHVVDDENFETLSAASSYHTAAIATLETAVKELQEQMNQREKDIGLLVSRNTELSHTITTLAAKMSTYAEESSGNRFEHHAAAPSTAAGQSSNQVLVSSFVNTLPSSSKPATQEAAPPTIKKRVQL